MPRVLIAGCGFVGEAAFRLLQAGGWEVTGVTLSEESAARLSGGGLSTIACDISDPGMLKEKLGGFAGIDAVVHCASAGHGGGEEAYRKIYLHGARNLLEFLQPQRFIFTGSTSVYAQMDGGWVTEESAAEPTVPTGFVLRMVEELVLRHGGIVTRLAGIYGPGRWALLRKFLDGMAVIEEEGSRWLNNIHRDDAAGAIAFLLNNGAAGGVYNVVDDTPLSQADCYRILSKHFKKPMPPSGPVDADRKRGVTNKRVSNAKLKGLGWVAKFPSVKEGLRADPRATASLDD